MGKYANFYNSVENDRVYNADDMSEWLEPFFKTGVFNNGFFVSAQSGMRLNVGGGFVNIKGKTKKFESTIVTIEQAHSTLNRIDSIVVRRDDNRRDFFIEVVTGNTAVTPRAPTPTRNATIYELVIAEVYVGKSEVTIKQSNITDTRPNSSKCGWVVSNVEEVNFNQISAQFNSFIEEFKQKNTSAFGEWFRDIQNTLDSDTAGNLYNLITRTRSEVQSTAPMLTSLFTNLQKKEKTVTLRRNGWGGNQYTLEDSDITNNSIQYIAPVPLSNAPTETEKEYIKTLQKMNLVSCGQTKGRLYLYCLGTVPNKDINIRLVIEPELINAMSKVV